VNLHLVALRRVLKQCWRLGHLSGEDYQRAAAVPGVAGSRLPAGRALARRELAALLAACPAGTAAGTRDVAVLATLFTAGLRRGELAALMSPMAAPPNVACGYAAKATTSASTT